MAPSRHYFPAFPRPASEDKETEYAPHSGMNLRDYFAAAALNRRGYDFRQAPAELAKRAYEEADAMIAEREQES